MGARCTTGYPPGKACPCSDENRAPVEYSAGSIPSPIVDEDLVVGSPALTGKDDAEAWCLCWMIDSMDQDDVSDHIIFDLHAKITNCIGMFGSKIIFQDAVSGVIQGFDLDSANMSAADTLARMGQLICRWCMSVGVVVRAGIATGRLRKVSLAMPGESERSCYFGEAFSSAKQLCIDAEQENFVHMSIVAKEGLEAFRFVPLLHSERSSSYYLDPLLEVKAGETSRDGSFCYPETPGGSKHPGPLLMDVAPIHKPSSNKKGKMSFAEFKGFLLKYKVDISKFGKGHAKSLQEFYDSVVHEEKSYLVVRGHTLERMVDIVRISLRVRDGDGRPRDLRLASKVHSDGKEHKRNQKLAMVLSAPEDNKWDAVMEQCFATKFGLSSEEYRQNIILDKDSMTCKEEKSMSTTIPGIKTTYRVHNITLNVKDKRAKALEKMGLPQCADFLVKGHDNTHPKDGKDGTSRTWTWALLETTSEDDLMTLLQTHGIDIGDFSVLAFTELHDEVYEKKLSTLEVRHHELMRTISLIKIWLHADILNVDHCLQMKSKFEKGVQDDSVKGNALSMRIPTEMDLYEAFEECLLQRLGISPEFQEHYLIVDQASHKVTEEIAYSKSYPGLKTLYLVNEFHASVNDSYKMQGIGLPDGTDFSFQRKETLSSGGINLIITHWSWDVVEAKLPRKSLVPTLSDTPSSMSCKAAKKRVPIPDPLQVADRVSCPSGLVIENVLRKNLTDWKRAKAAATKIRDPSYTCKHYWEDICGAFPELRLYVASSHESGVTTTAGRSGDDEYQRTIGALFAVYWLMRLGLDGKESFCFGLKDDWAPREYMPEWIDVDGEYEVRQTFYNDVDWDALNGLLKSAGLIKPDGKHDIDRTLAMLVLMAIHDIMKLELLLPIVEHRLSPFCGYQAGEVVSDHDVALSYVLENFPTVLPSFNGLSKKMQEAVRFTHCKMEYNMGWLVQAEAPPGALFKRFREVVISGQVSSQDIAFYFVHWFTDLAGAEPYPLEGCEKLVLKFPLKVLKRFIESFAIVQNLSPVKSETQIFEEYLQWRWQTHDPSLGKPPLGPGSIAQMRLILMAQGDSKVMVESLKTIEENDRNVLFEELALTGCRGQFYDSEQIGNVEDKGPAFLVYYGPALLQKAGKKDPKSCLMILAELYRQARVLWPFSAEMADNTVTIRIDAMKELDAEKIKQPDSGNVFVLIRNSSVDASAKLIAPTDLKEYDQEDAQVLNFSGARKKNLIKRKTQIRTKDTTVVGKDAVRRLRSKRVSGPEAKSISIAALESYTTR